MQILQNLKPALRWNVPLMGSFKMNVDAGFSSHLREANLGIVIRNHTSSILYSVVTRVGVIDSPLHVEFMAILFGLQESRNYDIDSLYIESDSLLAIREIEAGQGSMSERFGVISEVLRLSLQYEFSRFSHISKVTNGCAHNLTKIPCNMGEHKVWRNSLPPSFCNPNLV